jgi:tRNA-splicing ligase RtcB
MMGRAISRHHRAMIFGQHDANTLAQYKDVSSRAERAALMADGHLGYVMPIGGVAAYRNRVSVVGVGFDIACGNAAIRTDLHVGALGSPRRRAEIADAIFHSISFGIGRTNLADDAPLDHPLFEEAAWGAVPKSHRHELREKARAQLGTVGAGNHYVDVFADEADQVWVGVHFGSRGFGHNIASAFIALSQGLRWGQRGREIEVLLDVDEPMGHDYWQLMTLAGRYAYAGREWVVRKVVELLGGQEQDLVHNHHNYCWVEEVETPGGLTPLHVIRKGATPAFPGQRGFVGGSMADDAVILQGATSAEARETQQRALFSTVHGAGRVMSRTAARGKRRKGKVLRPPRVDEARMMQKLERRGIVLRGGDLDEAPQVYRRLDDVLTAQGNTIEVLHRLRPQIVCMAPRDTFDPYRD